MTVLWSKSHTVAFGHHPLHSFLCDALDEVNTVLSLSISGTHAWGSAFTIPGFHQGHSFISGTFDQQFEGELLSS